MFRIGEFSKITQVSIRMLRYYDETGLLKPAQVEKWSGYRLYSTEQIPTLNKILFLRDVGFNVAEIAGALTQGENVSISEQLKQKHINIKEAIQAEQSKLSKIEQAIKDIQQEQIHIHYNFSIKKIPSYQVISLRKIMPNYFSERELWNEMFTYTNSKNIAESGMPFSIYYDMECKESDVEIGVCIPVTQMGLDQEPFVYFNTEPVPLMACTMVYGEFKNIANVYKSFADWLHDNNQYRMRGPNRQIVHRGEWNEDSSDKYLTEIQIPIEKIK